MSSLVLLAVLAVLVFSAALAFRGLFLAIFRKGHRKRGALFLALSPVAALIGVLGLMEAEARLGGWPSSSAKIRAEKAGFSDPLAWADKEAEIAASQAKDKVKADAAKAQAEAEAQAAQARAKADQEAAEAAEEAAFQATGRHCLNPFTGANDPLIRLTSTQLVDPDSFEHIETAIAPANEAGIHAIVMRYRATNGFGGFSIGLATGLVESATCMTTILSVE